MEPAVSFQDLDQPSKRVCLGKIATAHGVRGLVKIRCEADDPHLLDEHGPVYTSATGQDTLTLTMKNSLGNTGGKYWLAEVAGIADRDAALALGGTELWIDRDQLPQLEDDDEFYIDDLVGLKVVNTTGKDVGKVIGVNNFGAGDLLEIQPESGESFFLIFTNENVPEVSLADGKITITPQ